MGAEFVTDTSRPLAVGMNVGGIQERRAQLLRERRELSCPVPGESHNGPEPLYRSRAETPDVRTEKQSWLRWAR